MSLVPVYSAWINIVQYSQIIDWDTPIIYNRSALLSDALKGHTPIPYSVTRGMRPVMDPSPFPYSAISFYPNNGNVEGVAYNYQISADPASFGFSGDWDFSKMAQVQMAHWANHVSYLEDFIEALEARSIEDAWLTTKVHVALDTYEDDIALASFALDNDRTTDTYSVMGSMVTTATKKPQPVIVATSCEFSLTWHGYRRFYKVLETIENLVAFADDAPDIEFRELEYIPGNYVRNMGHDLTLAELGITPILVRGLTIRDIQPAFFEPAYSVAYTRPYSTSPGSPLIDFRTVMSFSQAAAASRQAMEAWLGVTNDVAVQLFDALGNLVYADAVPASTGSPTVNGFDYGKGDIGVYNTSWGTVGYFNSGGYLNAPPTLHGGDSYSRSTLLINISYGAGTVSHILTTSSVNNGSVSTARPKAWDHNDPDLAGYVPYHPQLFGMSDIREYMEEYIRSPDNRFDGLYFAFKIKAAIVTRNWHAFIRNVQVSENLTSSPFKSGKLTAYAFKDIETGEIIDQAPSCSAMTPITTSLSPDLIDSPTYPGFDWDSYEWPASSVTIPAGTFLLEDGSPAPIYPTFYGAYVYDLHLKKWGKFDGEYKRLLDYSAINTYLPSQQSYTRFGIFGGILTADGKIRIFDEFPAVSQITYGKIGYYRQGMTSLEEVRVHHREFKTGSIKIESSVEGKLIDGAFTLEEPFVDSSSWIKKGGYSAKWHNVTVIGQFDLTYLEFRGITTGKR